MGESEVLKISKKFSLAFLMAENKIKLKHASIFSLNAMSILLYLLSLTKKIELVFETRTTLGARSWTRFEKEVILSLCARAFSVPYDVKVQCSLFAGKIGFRT